MLKYCKSLLFFVKMATDKPQRVTADWIKRWDNNQIGFHKSEVHHLLMKHLEKLGSDAKPGRIFVPLCGKSLDLKWLADQGIQTVGIDIANKALEQFFTENGLDRDEAAAPELGATGKVLCSKDGMLKLYCGDLMKLSVDIAGTFDAIWDRASIVALNREDVQKYVQILKSLLKPGGRILCELMQYDLSILDDVTSPTKPPPPFPMFEEDLKKLYEPECSVQYIDQYDRTLQGKDIIAGMYLIIKK